MRQKEPVRLYKKEEPKIPPLTPLILMLILVILGVISILMALACKSPYNMVWA